MGVGSQRNDELRYALWFWRAMKGDNMFQRMKSIALHALCLDFTQRATIELNEARRISARRTVGRYARGSVALQGDLFITQSDLEREREEAKKYRFAS